MRSDDPNIAMLQLAAFYGRGNGDYMASHDLEDLIAGLDGRDSIVSEVKESGSVSLYLADAFRQLLALDEFHDALPCHLPSDAARQRVSTAVPARGVASTSHPGHHDFHDLLNSIIAV